MWHKSNSYTKYIISSWAGDVMIAILEAIVSLGLMAWDPFKISTHFPNDKSAGTILSFIAYFFLMLGLTFIGLLIYHYICFSTRGYVKETDPFIRVKETDTFPLKLALRHKSDNGKGKVKKVVDFEFIYIHLINDPKAIIVDSLATYITARITYKNKDGVPLFPSFWGIWADKPSISTLKPGEQPRDLLFTNIAPGDLGQKINIGIHEIGKPYYFAYSQESAKYKFFRNKALKVKNKEVYVDIEVKGSIVDRTIKCKITRSGKKVKIEQIEKPNWEA